MANLPDAAGVDVALLLADDGLVLDVVVPNDDLPQDVVVHLLASLQLDPASVGLALHLVGADLVPGEVFLHPHDSIPPVVDFLDVFCRISSIRSSMRRSFHGIPV